MYSSWIMGGALLTKLLVLGSLVTGSATTLCADSVDKGPSLLQAKSLRSKRQLEDPQQFASLLRDALAPYKTQEGYTFTDLTNATLARGPYGALAALPELAKLKALDTDGDQIISEAELLEFKGLANSFCRSLGEVKFGCRTRCEGGEDEFDGNFPYLTSKGTEVYSFPQSVELYAETADSFGAGAITKAQKRAIGLGLAQVVLDNVEGATCEFGVYQGGTSVFLQQMLNSLRASESHPLHLFDSFEGLPDCDKEKDLGMCGPGEMAEPQSTVQKAFEERALPVPPMHKGYFSDIPESEFPTKISFAFIDGDLYPSMFSALERVWPRLSEGGIVLLHDYAWEGYPGTEDAAVDFLKDKTEKVQLVGGEHGVACTIGMLRKR